jgi:uncharacterized membrane protein
MLRHLLPPPWLLRRRAFDARALQALEAAIADAERDHRGEIRFAVEATLGPRALLRGQPARERALEVFSELRVWDTAEDNGVLIYVLLADHDVEIVADRGVAARVDTAEWAAICRDMEACFKAGRYADGAGAGIRRVGTLLARHYPGADRAGNELPDRPHVR